MVRRSALRWSLSVLTLLAAAGPASSAQITMTGDVEKDFPAGTERIGIYVNHPFADNPAVSDPSHVSQPDWMTAAGQINGWDIKDMRVYYDQQADTLNVGLNFFGVAGSVDGTGRTVTDPRFMGNDVPNLGGQKAIAVGVDVNGDGKLDIVAGVPPAMYDTKTGQFVSKDLPGTGIDGFQVARYSGQQGAGLENSFGQLLMNQMGNLAFNPDPAHPDFEFTIKNFSKIPGLEFDPGNFLFGPGLGLQAFAGAPDDLLVGEDSIPFTRFAAAAIPEPATLLAWSAALGAVAAWQVRRRRGRRVA